MKASETRAFAREKLVGKWGKAASATLVFGLIEGIISLITWMFEENSLPSLIMSIINLVITVPISFGFLITMFKLNDDEEISYVGFLNDGFANFKKSWSVTLQTLRKLIVPLLLFIGSIILLSFALTATMAAAISGKDISFLALLAQILFIAALIYLFIKSLSYTFAIYILNDNLDIDAKEAVEKSAELMQGNIGSYICLKVSFIGWIILGICTLGIGFLWLTPYIRIASINFYRNLINE